MGPRGLRSLLAAGWLLSLVAGCARVDPAAELAAGTASLNAGRYSEAAIRFSNVIQAQPNNGEAHRLRAELALRLGDYAGAADEFDRARKLGVPTDSIALGLAEAWTILGRAEDALALLDSVAATHTADALYRVERAEALLRLGRAAAAETALGPAQNGAQRTRAQIVRAGIAFARSDPAGAEKLLDQALQSAPSDPRVLVARAEIFARTARLSQAAEDLTKAADVYRQQSLSEHELATLFALVQMQLARNDLDAAEATASALAQRAPQAALTAYLRGLVAYRRGRFDEAADLIQPLVNASPQTTQFRSLLGAIHLARGNFGQAEQEFQTVLATSPRDPAAIKLLAETRLRQRRPEAALAALRGIEDAAAEDPQVGMLSGIASLLSGNTQQGLLYLEQAASLDPSNEILKLQLARAYLAAGRDADASKLLGGAFGAAGTSLEAGLLRLFADIRQGTGDAGGGAANDLLRQFPSEPRALTAVGTYYQLRGENQRARELFERAAGLETTDTTARMFVAAALVQEGRSQEAEQLLARVIEQQPDNAQALTALAELRTARGALPEATDLLRKAVEHSTSIAPRLSLAQLLVRQGDLAGAKAQLDAATKIAPDNPEVGAVAGLVALAEGRPKDAAELLKKAEAALPNRLGVTLALARAELASGAPDAARSTVRRVLEVAPKSLPLRFTLGEAELALGNAAEASSIAAALKADYPAQSGGYALEAEAQIAARRYSAAADTLASAFAREPTWPILTRQLSALQLAGRQPDAVAAAEKWVAANPKHVPGALVLAGLQQDAGSNEEALRGYQTVLGLDANNVGALNNAAWLLNELARPGALPLAEKAHELAGDNPAVLDTLGWILLAEGHKPEAIARLSRAAELAPDVPAIHYHLAKALAAAGQPDKARAVLTKLVDGSRDFEQRADARRLLESL